MLDVSILIPVYCKTPQSLEWLDECIKSAKRQNCEIVCYDDASPVDIKPITEKHKVDILRAGEANRGAAYSRNMAAEAATKKFLLPLDCDDRLVDGAVKKLLKVWTGVPVYPDVRKFGDEQVDHFVLLDFHCDHIITHVGFSSVNVLHTKEQWQHIGGWNPSINFFEDGEYNARLFATYCGVHLREPLVEYRIHPHQRTKQYKSQASSIARRIVQVIRSYPMACPSCGKKKSALTASNKAAQSVTRSVPMTQDVNSLPGEVGGRVLAQYIGGKGKGKHYYQGRNTKFRYQVKHGQYLHVDPRDVREYSENSNPSLLVKVVKSNQPKPVSRPTPSKKIEVVEEKLPEPKPERTPVMNMVKTPVVDDVDIPDVTHMSIPKIVKFNPNYEQAVAMLRDEQQGMKRKGAIEYLKKIVEA